MRIIAGTYRSLKLKTLEGPNTRPTQDKIKEAMFSSLGTYFYEGKMLDLFAGSGGIGLESISRGIEKAYFCDQSREAIKIIEENINHLKVKEQCMVVHGNYQLALERYKEETFTFIFIDPPYALKVIEECLNFIDQYNMLDTYGIIVVESSKEDCFLENYGNLIKKKEKKYGISKLTYFEKRT